MGHSPRGRKESDMAEPLHFKGTFHAKMGTIKDRNSMDLTEAEGEGNGTSLQYFYLENPMDGGAW